MTKSIATFECIASSFSDRPFVGRYPFHRLITTPPYNDLDHYRKSSTFKLEFSGGWAPGLSHLFQSGVLVVPDGKSLVFISG